MRFKLTLTIFLITVLSFGQSLKSPSEFLGYELGTRFTRHHRVIEYFKYVSNTIGNVKMYKYGETNEHRPLYVTYVSSQNNINNLEQIRQSNLSQVGLSNSSASNKKAIVWLSYNVHGNEASSTEASMQTLFELVTTKKNLLENTLVIMDPCLNPDGRDRYANWYNQVKSTPYNPNQDAREHRDPWPTGRPNHYLFDLNRDWAWATQVETQQRLKVYNKWLPHVHVDFHEQGINSPYYFAPAAEPIHEVVSDWQRDFQDQIGKNHAKYFDKEGWLYFTKERFDILYPSYGDSYPMYMGSIGMTYEQAGHGRAGLGVHTNHGYELTLVDRVKHHTTTGISTVEMSAKNVENLNNEFVRFFKNNNHKYKSYVLKNENQDRINRIKNLLDKHEIEYEFAVNTTVKGFDYNTQKSGRMEVTSKDLVIHSNQPKGKMVKALFEPVTKLTDSLTYDITAWSLPYAHGLKSIASTSKVASTKKDNTSSFNSNQIDNSAYAYLAKWNSLEDASFLGQLLQNDIQVRFTKYPFTLNGEDFAAGTLIILRHDNQSNKEFDADVIEIANKEKRELKVAKTGYVDSGKDFGSSEVLPINSQKIAVLAGEATSSLAFGEVWYFFEQQLKYPITTLDAKYLNSFDLNQYDVLVIPSGYYRNEVSSKKIKDFVRNGGTIIAIDRALRLFADKKEFALKTKSAKKEDGENNDKLIPHDKEERESIKNLITGAIFNASVDTTHPIAFGYDNEYFSLKLGSSAYDFLPSGNVAYFTKDSKKVSGFAGQNAIKNIPETLLIGEERIGRGSIIYMVDNPLFRSFWENGKMFFVNSLFFRNSSNIK